MRHPQEIANFRSKYGEWAVVTGASSGIGKELARQLAAAGLNIAAVARDAGRLQQLVSDIQADSRVKVLPIALDLAQQGGAQRVQEALSGQSVGLLVASAGFGTSGPLIDNDLAGEMRMVDLNCKALLEFTHLFGNAFTRQRRGGIILMSSIVSFQGVPRSANYAATKAYVQSLGEAVADELSPHGVDVLVSAPGPTQSGFAERAGMRFSRAESAEQVARETIAALGKKRIVVPGGFSKFLHGSLMTAPRFARVRIMKMVMKSMT